MVPVLFYAFISLGVPADVVMHCAVATSSSVIILNAIRSVKSHHSHGAVDWDLLWPKNPFLSYALWIGVGAFLGAIWLAPRLSGQALILIFAGVATLVALKFIFGQPRRLALDLLLLCQRQLVLSFRGGTLLDGQPFQWVTLIC